MNGTKTTTFDGKGHRQRLKKKFLEAKHDNIVDYELLELLLTYAIPRKDVKPIAKQLLHHFGSYQHVICADYDELLTIPYIKDHAAILIKLIGVSAKHLLRDRLFQSNHIVKDWQDFIDYITATLRYENNEQLRVLYLNNKYRLLDDYQHHQGTVNETAFYPREIIKRAVNIGATSIIVVHNHPSGDPKPSRADIDNTLKLKKALDALEIHLHDHIIIGKTSYISFKRRGII